MEKQREIKTFDRSFIKVSLLFLGLVLLICFFPKWFTQGVSGLVFNTQTGAIGDTIGGTMGPFIAILAAALTFFAFWVQFKANELQKFEIKDQKALYAAERVETRFLEMVKFCRENLSEMKYEKYSETQKKVIPHEGRRVPILIFREFTICLEDIDFLFWSENLDYYLKPNYRLELQEIVDRNNIKASMLSMIKIDIAYAITYFGVGKEGRISIEHNFKEKYQGNFFGQLLDFISRKPKMEDLVNSKRWQDIAKRIKFNQKDLVGLDKGQVFRAITSDIDEKIEYLKSINPYYKYYGGHQHRLGHYFRHLFHSYVFLDSRKEVSNEDKYLLSKLLRSQLSTYEQALILINSISSLGMAWEYIPKAELQVENSYSKGKLISTYNVITNLPGEHLNGIKYNQFYPLVAFEFTKT